MPIYNVCHVCEVIEYNICHVYEVIKYDVCHVCGADVYNALIFKVHSTATNIDLKNSIVTMNNCTGPHILLLILNC